MQILCFWTLSIVLFLSKTLSSFCLKTRFGDRIPSCFCLKTQSFGDRIPSCVYLKTQRFGDRIPSCFCLKTQSFGDRIQSPKRFVLHKNRTMDNVQRHNIYIILSDKYLVMAPRKLLNTPENSRYIREDGTLQVLNSVRKLQFK
jgi:hypothetical protein